MRKLKVRTETYTTQFYCIKEKCKNVTNTLEKINRNKARSKIRNGIYDDVFLSLLKQGMYTRPRYS